LKGIIYRALPYSLSLFVYLFIYGWVALRGSFDYAAVEYLYQSLGSEALTKEPIQSLLTSHIQPIGLNAVYALVLNGPFNSSATLQTVFAIAGALTVFLIVATLRNIGQSQLVAGTAGVLYALLPSTVLYVMWPYNTSMVAFLSALGFFGLSLMRHRPSLGAVIWTTSLIGLFLVRPSFVWIVVLILLIVPIFLIKQWRQASLIAIASFGFLVIVVVQGHHSIQFGTVTTTSWSGQNIVKGLVFSGVVTEADLVEAANEDPCLVSLAIDPEFWGDLSNVDVQCFGSRAGMESEAIALRKETKLDAINFQHNSLKRLELSQAWNELALRVMQQDPLLLPKMFFGVGGGPSSFERMMEPSFIHPILQENLVAGSPVMSIMRPIGVMFPVGSLVLMLLGLLALLQGRFRDEFSKRIFFVAMAVSAYGLLVASLLEFGENQRFLVEIYPILMISAAMTVGLLLQRNNSERKFVPI